jgi:5-methyltetrahydropteroyltriglutamate--homocysteine methyltransferase
MPLTSTVIGSFRKPDYLGKLILDWFTNQETHEYILQYNEVSKKNNPEEMEKVFLKASSAVLKLQEEIGIDVVTDGEMRRENYVYYFCRKLNGFNFENLTEVSPRNGAYTAKVPTITGPVSSKEKDPWIWKEWLTCQEMSKKPVKITLPAPLTIINTVMNEYYKDNEKELSDILVKEINREVVALSKAGCKYIQVLHPIPKRHCTGKQKSNLEGLEPMAHPLPPNSMREKNSALVPQLVEDSTHIMY